MTTLNTSRVKMMMNHYGIKALVRKYNHNTISVFVSKNDIDKAKLFFADFDIKRKTMEGLVTPFEVNSGEFNNLICAI